MSEETEKNKKIGAVLSPTQKKWKRAKRCEIRRNDGLVACYYLSLERLHLQAVIATNAPGSLRVAAMWEVKIHARHRECKRRDTWWIVGLSSSDLDSLLKNTDRKAIAGTSTISRMELKRIGQEKNGAPSVDTPGTNLIGGITRAELLTDFGSNMRELLSTEASPEAQEPQTTS